MTIEFNRITGDEVELFVTYPNLFSGFWSNTDLLMECDVNDSDLAKYKDYYKDLFDFGVTRKQNNLVVPANLPFTIVKTKSPQAYFEIRRGYTNLEITELSELSFIADLTTLGEKVYKISKEQHITMLEAIEQLEYYANILNCNIQ